MKQSIALRLKQTVYKVIYDFEGYLWEKRDLFDLRTRMKLVYAVGTWAGHGYREYAQERALGKS